MKLKQWLYGLTALSMLAACSEDVSNTPSTSPDDIVGSTGFIAVKIGMPSDASTRGVNDEFADGLTSEYKVSSAAVIFFKGATEEGAKFYKAYAITDDNFDDPKDPDNPNYPQISSKDIATFPVDFAKDADDRLWAMAVLNYGGVLTIKNGEDEKVGATVTVGGKDLTAATTIEEFMKLTTNATLYQTENGTPTNFFMINTPYSRVQGGNVAPNFRPDGSNYFRVLADVDRSKIYETKEQAEADPATEIFVERAVAKVEVMPDFDAINGDLPEGISVKEIKWVLDNTEPSAYIVRNLESVDDGYNINGIPSWASYKSSKSDNYRFIGNVSFKDLAKYRVYFCADPNGDGLDLTDNENDQTYLTTVTKSTVTPTFKEISTLTISKPQYCKENTFDVKHMDYLNTTRCVIEVTFQDSKGNTPVFYTMNLNNKQMFTYENAARALAVEVISNQKVSDAYKNYFESLNQPYDNNASTLNLVYSADDATELTAINSWMKIVFSKDNARLTVKDIILRDGDLTNPKDITFAANDKTAALEEINATHEIKAYSAGKSYYSVLIKHFGNQYTPWTSNADATPTTAESYPDYNAAEYLGRYGVVRNNWYVVNITGINNFGEPSYKDLHLDGTPDDKVEKEESIACRINILSWAKRSQNETL